MKYVSSTNLKFVDYDNDTEILTIGFKSGSVYQYYDVPENIVNRLIKASSLGSYFHNYIKYEFDFEQIE